MSQRPQFYFGGEGKFSRQEFLLLGAASSLLNLSMQAAQEELRAELHEQVKMRDLLLYQVRQRSQARDALQRWLQQLQGAQLDDNQHQVQVHKTPSWVGQHQ